MRTKKNFQGGSHGLQHAFKGVLGLRGGADAWLGNLTGKVEILTCARRQNVLSNGL